MLCSVLITAQSVRSRADIRAAEKNRLLDPGPLAPRRNHDNWCTFRASPVAGALMKWQVILLAALAAAACSGKTAISQLPACSDGQLLTAKGGQLSCVSAPLSLPSTCTAGQVPACS